MSRRDSEQISWMVVGLVVLVATIVACAGGWPQYRVYSERLSGEAALARSEAAKRIRVEEAQARLDASKLLAQAEVEEAKGAAEANALLADGLGGPENYIAWRYILMLQQANEDADTMTVIYVPTEGQIPIMEAGRVAVPRMEGQPDAP